MIIKNDLCWRGEDATFFSVFLTHFIISLHLYKEFGKCISWFIVHHINTLQLLLRRTLSEVRQKPLPLTVAFLGLSNALN